MRTARRNDDPPDEDTVCHICFGDPDVGTCCCPTCKHCGDAGNPACYHDRHIIYPINRHWSGAPCGLFFSNRQLDQRMRRERMMERECRMAALDFAHAMTDYTMEEISFACGPTLQRADALTMHPELTEARLMLAMAQMPPAAADFPPCPDCGKPLTDVGGVMGCLCLWGGRMPTAEELDQTIDDYPNEHIAFQ